MSNGKMILQLRYGEGDAEQSALVGDEPFFVGRSPSCELVLHEESVSRRHARVTRDAEGWSIIDLSSKNGIKINTYPALQHRLRDGDRIDLGAVRLYVHIERAAIAQPAQVVFETSEDKGRRTEIIDIARLESALGSAASTDVARAGASPLAPSQGEDESTTRPWQLFGAAVEALISCDSLDETLEKIIALVFDHVPAERGVICLYDEATQKTTPRVMRTREGASDEEMRISSQIANDVIARRQALLVNDPLQDERFGGAESVILMHIRSAMCAPLYNEGRVCGFVYVDRQSVHDPFTATHLQVLSSLGILSAVAVEQATLRDELRNEQEMRGRLSRYSSAAVVDQILSTAGPTEMAADEADTTILFADLTGFTSMAEDLEPAETIRILNRVFERLTEAIFEFEGTLDKFRGDGLMAFFGAPLAMADHAQRAVAAALRMQEQLGEINRYSPDRQLSMRIGINSGVVVVGDIGSPQRKDYTVIGDVVNTASRLESAVALPGEVVIGEETFKRVKGRFRCEPLEPARLKGKRHIVQPYRVQPPAAPLPEEKP